MLFSLNLNIYFLLASPLYLTNERFLFLKLFPNIFQYVIFSFKIEFFFEWILSKFFLLRIVYVSDFTFDNLCYQFGKCYQFIIIVELTSIIPYIIFTHLKINNYKFHYIRTRLFPIFTLWKQNSQNSWV